MGFDSEEELEIWYASEKEKLDGQFTENIEKDSEKIPQSRETYNAGMKKLISRYQSEYERLLEKMKKQNMKG